MFMLFLLFACTDSPLDEVVAELPEVPVQAEDDLGRVLAIARACVTLSPDVKLSDDVAIERGGEGIWQVSMRDRSPQARLLVASVHPVRGSCGDLVMEVPETAPLGSLHTMFDEAWACGELLGGNGVGGSALLREGLSMSFHEGRRPVFNIPEASPTQIPSGQQVALGPCALVGPRD